MGRDRDERQDIDPGVDDEIRFHLEGRVEELMRSGLNRAEAVAEARRRFGDPERVGAECTAVRREQRRREERRAWIDGLRTDARLVVRGLRRSPGLFASIVLTLGIAIGAVTSLFSVADRVLLRPLPLPEPDELVYLWQNDRVTGTLREPAGTADFFDFRDRTDAYEAVSMFTTSSQSITLGGEARFVSTLQAELTLPEVLGLPPVIGRWFEEPDGPHVALLSESMWRREFGGGSGSGSGSDDVLGTTVSIGGMPYRVIGVVPSAAAAVTGPVDLWTPTAVTATTATRNPHLATVVGRLRSPDALPAARAELAELAARMEQEDQANLNRGVFVEPVGEFVRGDVRTTIRVVFGATLLLLLIAAANTALLLTARAEAEERPAAIHAALGATSTRLARRGLLEAAVFVAVSGAIGLAVAAVGVRGIGRLVPPPLAVDTLSLDVRAVGFVALLAVPLTAAFALVPAIRARARDLQRSLGHAATGGRASGRGRAVLVTAQSALATVLLVGALLLGVSVHNLMNARLGFDTESIVRMSLVLGDVNYPRDFAVYPEFTEVLTFQRELLDAVGRIPGVTAAGMTTNHPLDAGFTNSISIDGGSVPDGIGELATRMVTPGYFETVGVELAAGRWMDRGRGTADAGEVLINRTAAEAVFPGEDPIGRSIGFWGAGFREIVGVVEDEAFAGQRVETPPAFYTNLFQTPAARDPLLLMVRTAGDPLEVVPRLRGAVRSIDPGVAVYDVATMEETLRTSVARERFAGRLVTIFASVALVLAGVGVFGVLAYMVARRRREIGVRLVLGARPAQVRRWVVLRSVRLVFPGIALGLAAAAVSARLLDGLVFGLSTRSPAVYVAAALVLAGAALVGASLPARTAAATDPGLSLRNDG